MLILLIIGILCISQSAIVVFYENVYQEYSPYPLLSNCVNPSTVPVGLTVSSNCVISGVASSLASVDVEISSGYTVTIVVTSCNGVVIYVNRQYAQNALLETYLIGTPANLTQYDSSDGNQVDYEEVEKWICVSSRSIVLSTISSVMSWSYQSYISISTCIYGSQQVLPIIRTANQPALHIRNQYTLQILPTIPQSSSWIKMSSITPSTILDGVGGILVSTPDSTTTPSLYNTTFTLTESDLMSTNSISVSIRYQYCVIIIINANQVFNNNATVVNNNYVCNNAYLDSSFHTVVLPLSYTHNGIAYNNAVVGDNWVAILLVPQSSSNDVFDCTLRLVSSEERDRVMDYTLQSSMDSPMYDLYVNNTCYSNHESRITFNNDRYEWLTNIRLHHYYNYSTSALLQIQGCYAQGSLCDIIGSFTAEQLNSPSNTTTLWLPLSRPYSSYLLGITNELCVNEIMLYSSTPYPQSVYTSQVGYSVNTILPMLTDYSGLQLSVISIPTGLSFNQSTGEISGTLQTEGFYTVNLAVQTSTSTINSVITLSAEVCPYSILKILVLTDYFPDEMAFSLTFPNSTIISFNQFTQSATYYPFYYCLPPGIYTLTLIDSYGDGWITPSGARISMLNDLLPIDVGMVAIYSSSHTFDFSPVFLTQQTACLTQSSSQQQSEWVSVFYSPQYWRSVIPATQSFTQQYTYLRYNVFITDSTTYPILNIYMNFTGGVSLYFNGNSIGIYNLDTSGNVLQSGSQSFLASIAVRTNGGMEGRNTVAFELNKGTNAVGTFDASSLFAYNASTNNCVNTVNTFTGFSNANAETITDFYVFSIFQQSAPVSWSTASDMGNQFNMMGVYLSNSGSYTISLNTLSPSSSSVISNVILNTPGRTLGMLPATNLISGYTQYSLSVTASSTVYLNAVLFMYCSSLQGYMCSSLPDEGYPSVNIGENAYISCPAFYQGYQYRTCEATGLFSDVVSNCSLYNYFFFQGCMNNTNCTLNQIRNSNYVTYLQTTLGDYSVTENTVYFLTAPQYYIQTLMIDSSYYSKLSLTGTDHIAISPSPTTLSWMNTTMIDSILQKNIQNDTITNQLVVFSVIDLMSTTYLVNNNSVISFSARQIISELSILDPTLSFSIESVLSFIVTNGVCEENDYDTNPEMCQRYYISEYTKIKPYINYAVYSELLLQPLVVVLGVEPMHYMLHSPAASEALRADYYRPTIAGVLIGYDMSSSDTSDWIWQVYSRRHGVNNNYIRIAVNPDGRPICGIASFAYSIGSIGFIV